MDTTQIKLDQEAAIEFKNFTLKIGSFSLQSPLTILRGSNGCGKSTFLRAIAGILSLSNGKRHVLSGTRFGFMPQNYREALLPWMSVKKNLHLINDENPEIVECLLSMGMSQNDLMKKPYQLSGGQCQRIALIRESYFKPHVLILDEPFAALDVHVIEQAGNLVAQTIKDGTKVIIATHDKLPYTLDNIPVEVVDIVRVSDDIAKVGGVA